MLIPELYINIIHILDKEFRLSYAKETSLTKKIILDLKWSRIQVLNIYNLSELKYSLIFDNWINIVKKFRIRKIFNQVQSRDTACDMQIEKVWK